MAEHLLVAETRTNTGKKFVKKLRRQGKIPGIFYAHNEKSIPITLDERTTMKILTSETSLFDFQIGKKKRQKAIIKDVQTDPVNQTLVHIDVMGVRLEEKITLKVPVRLKGEAVGIKTQGGILHQYLREIEVSCLPLDIPEFIEIDVTNLTIGDSINVGSLAIDKIELVGDSEQPIVSVLAPTVVKEPVLEEVKEAVEEALPKETPEGTKKES